MIFVLWTTKIFRILDFWTVSEKRNRKANAQCGAPSEEEGRAANGLCMSLTKMTIDRP